MHMAGVPTMPGWDRQWVKMYELGVSKGQAPERAARNATINLGLMLRDAWQILANRQGKVK